MPERAALMAALIVERPLCLECLEAKTGMDRSETDAYLARIANVLQLRRSAGDRCRACGEIGRVYWLMQPPAH
jgi:hypothetical protein